MKAAARAPTRGAVLKYADELRRRAERKWNPDHPDYDPYAKPYYPTTAAASRLSSELGPEKALAELARRASDAERKQQHEDEISTRAAARHRRRQTNASHERRSARERLRPGQRIDLVLAGFSTVQAAPAQRALDQRVSIVDGSAGTTPIPRFPGDPAAEARRIADDAARRIEALLEQARRRVVEDEQQAV